jgi:hypothetical protein
MATPSSPSSGRPKIVCVCCSRRTGQYARRDRPARVHLHGYCQRDKTHQRRRHPLGCPMVACSAAPLRSQRRISFTHFVRISLRSGGIFTKKNQGRCPTSTPRLMLGDAWTSGVVFPGNVFLLFKNTPAGGTATRRSRGATKPCPHLGAAQVLVTFPAHLRERPAAACAVLIDAAGWF